MAESIKKAVLPYATYQSFFNFISKLREHGMPNHITRSMFPGSNSGKASMSATLGVLGLVNERDEPTAAMRQLTDPESIYSEELAKILLNSYPFLKDGSLDLATTTTEKVVEKIKEHGASGSTVTKCMAFLLSAARDANITVSRYVKTPPPASRPGGKVSKKKTSKPMPVDPGRDFDDDGVANAQVITPPADHERIVVSAHGMEPWEIYVPKGLSQQQWRHGLKMAMFILENYRADEFLSPVSSQEDPL